MPAQILAKPPKQCVQEMIVYLKSKHKDWSQKQIVAVAYKECGANKGDFQDWCPYTFLHRSDFIDDFSHELLDAMGSELPLSMITINEVDKLLPNLRREYPHATEKELLLKAYYITTGFNEWELYKFGTPRDDFYDEIYFDHIILDDMLFDDAIPAFLVQQMIEGRNPSIDPNLLDPNRFTREMQSLRNAATAGATSSSNVSAIGYVKGNLVVAFNNGGVYAYKVDPKMYEQMAASGSKGKFVWEILRGHNMGPVWGNPMKSTPGGTIASLQPYVKLNGLSTEILSGGQKSALTQTKMAMPDSFKSFYDPSFKTALEQEVSRIKKETQRLIDQSFKAALKQATAKRPKLTKAQREEKKAVKQQEQAVSAETRQIIREIRKIYVKEVKDTEKIDESIRKAVERFTNQTINEIIRRSMKQGGVLTAKDAQEPFELSQAERDKILDKIRKEEEFKALKEEVEKAELQLLAEIEEEAIDDIVNQIVNEPEEFTKEEVQEVNSFIQKFLSRAKWVQAKKKKPQRETEDRRKEREAAEQRKEERRQKYASIDALKEKIKKLKVQIRRAKEGNIPATILKSFRTLLKKLLKQLQGLISSTDFITTINLMDDLIFDDFREMSGPITRAGEFEYGKTKLIKDWSNLKQLFNQTKHIPIFGSSWHNEDRVIGFAYNFTFNDETEQVFADGYTFDHMENISSKRVNENTTFPVSIRYFENDRTSDNIQYITDILHLALDPESEATDRCSSAGGLACYMKQKQISQPIKSDFMPNGTDAAGQEPDQQGNAEPPKDVVTISQKEYDDFLEKSKKLDSLQDDYVNKIGILDTKITQADSVIKRAEEREHQIILNDMISKKEKILKDDFTFTLNKELIEKCEDPTVMDFLSNVLVENEKPKSTSPQGNFAVLNDFKKLKEERNKLHSDFKTQAMNENLALMGIKPKGDGK